MSTENVSASLTKWTHTGNVPANAYEKAVDARPAFPHYLRITTQHLAVNRAPRIRAKKTKMAALAGSGAVTTCIGCRWIMPLPIEDRSFQRLVNAVLTTWK